MTTRRRRTGSDSVQFDVISEQEDCDAKQQLLPISNRNSSFTAATALDTNTQQKQVVGLNNFGWRATSGPQAAPQNTYKKTDCPAPGNGYTSSPGIFTPAAPYNNSNYSASNTNSYTASKSSYQHTNNSESLPSNFYSFGESISNYLSSNFTTSSNTQNTLFCSNPTPYGSQGCSDYSDSYNSELDCVTMACRDRTTEFSGIIRSQQQGHLSNGVVGGRLASKSSKDITQYSHFMKRSRMVGRNISSTYAKLEKLTLLARKRSLFDDSQDTEVQELTAIIRHDLGSLTKQLEDLRHSSKAPAGAVSSHMQKHSANLVGSLQTKVASITHKFRDVLEVRTENLKKQAERREQFTGDSSSMGSAAPRHGAPHTASVLLADEAKAAAAARRGNGDVVLDFAGSAPSTSSGPHQQQLMLMEEQDSLLQARAETMKTIESTIVELGTMFTHLAAMVKEQDEFVHRIDANVDDAEMNVEAAHTELLKYFRSVSSNRWLMLKVFGIVIFFFVIFVVFMA